MKYLKVAQEAVDFQKDGIGKTFEEFFKELSKSFMEDKMSSRQLQKSDYPEKLRNLIFARFGIKMNVIFNTYIECGVLYYSENRNHIFNTEIRPGNYNKKIKPKQHGKIDLRNAKVGGFFSEYEHTLYMNMALLISHMGLKEKELTALLLHEIGHVFSSAEFEDRSQSSNQILANIAESLRNKEDPKERIYLLQELGENLANDKDYFLEEKGDQRTILGIKFFKKYIKAVQSQLPIKNYDRTTSESLSDNFSARFGYGRDLVRALDIITRKSGHPDTTLFLRILFTIRELLLPVEYLESIFQLQQLLLLPIPYIKLFVNISIIFQGLMLLINFIKLGEIFNKDPYDTLERRYGRIRAQYVEFIKREEPDAEKLLYITQSINEIDAIISKLKPYVSPLSKLSNFIFTMNKKVINSYTEQQLLEELSSNELFVKSAEIQHLSNEDSVHKLPIIK